MHENIHADMYLWLDWRLGQLDNLYYMIMNWKRHKEGHKEGNQYAHE